MFLELCNEINTLGFGIMQDGIESGDVKKLRLEMKRVLRSTPSNLAKNLLRTSDLVASFASQSTIADVANALLGGGANAFSAFFLDKTRESNWQMPWHQNLRLPVEVDSTHSYAGAMVEHGVPHIIPEAAYLNNVLIVRIALDDQSLTNGALEFVPRSHRLGILSDAETSAVGATEPSVCPQLSTGDIFFFKALLVHRSRESQSNNRRRVLQLEYSAGPPPGGHRWYGL